MEKIIEKLKAEKLLPLYTVNDLGLLDHLESVLTQNNLSFVEITYRSDKASEAIKYLSESNELIVGAGTVTDVSIAKEAVENGAQFIVTPGIDIDVVKYCIDKNIPIFPGVATPTEIIQVKNLGISTVKFFPANVYGGLKAISALSGPFYDMNFIPTGGVNKENYLEFLNNDSIAAVGGSFIITEDMLNNDKETTDKHIADLVAKL